MIYLSTIAFIGCGNATEPEISSVSSPETSASYPEVDSYIKQQMMDENIPGLAVVVVQGDEIIYLKGFGVTNIKETSPVTPQTIFDLASISKSFTALGVLLLRDDGLIELDTPVQQYLPDFQINDPRASEITVRHLLNQTSGLPGGISEPLLFHDGDDAMEEMIAALSQVRLNHSPGLSFEYADMNYCLLGALIERVTGTTFEDYMKQRVFIPLCMSHTTLYPDEAAELGRAEGHQPIFGRVVARNMPIYRSALPAGWVMSSAEDMGRWLVINLNDGYTDEGQLIPADDIEELHTSAIVFEEGDEQLGYGMGWFISCEPGDVPCIWHGGDTPNFTADMMILPEHQLGVVVLVNSQAITIGHNIAPGVVNLILGLELEPIVVPWWAHWKAIDTIATVALVFNVLLVVVLIFCIWLVWRQFRARKRHFIGSLLAGPILPARQLAFYLAPSVLFIVFALVGYLVVQALYGYNFYEVLFLFRLAAPPGVWLSGMMLISVVLLWVLLPAFLALFTRASKADA